MKMRNNQKELNELEDETDSILGETNKKVKVENMSKGSAAKENTTKADAPKQEVPKKESSLDKKLEDETPLR